jgi:hypothetical protein
MCWCAVFAIEVYVISFQSRCIASPDAMFLNVDNEAVLLNTKTELYFGLDDVATAFWEDLTTAPSVETAVQQLLQKFDGVDEATLRKDLTEFINNLQMRGLLILES